MTRRKVLLIAVTVVVLVGGILGGIQIVGAIQGGNDNTDMTKSVARIVWFGQGKDHNKGYLCTGSVVGDQWVLTALHCLYPKDDLGGTLLDWHGFTVQLWQAGTSSLEYMSSLDRKPETMPTALSKDTSLYQDVALMHVAKSMKNYSWIKTIPTATMGPKIGTTLTEFGYGDTCNGCNPATKLQKSQQSSITRANCPTDEGSSWSNGNLCTASTSSVAWQGDSGGPLLWWYNGYWQQVGSASTVFSHHKGNSFWSEADGDTRKWILSYVFPTDDKSLGVKSLIGVILKDQASVASWLYEADGYRHWIPDGGTYNCLVSNGATVLKRPLRTIEALPDMVGNHATCTPRPAPTSPPASTVTPITHTPPTVTPPPPPTVTPHSTSSTAPFETAGGVAHTWTNYMNAGGTEGPSVAAYQTVKMSCRLTGFKVADGNTWWYRIAQSPWNNAYYVSADAFYNNGQTSGSLHGTPWVDTNIPVCAAPPPQPKTYSETAGPPSGSGTFTDYTNAGGTIGQRVAAYQTIQVTCRLTGFKVADGNTWWYKIASSPWSNTFYAPADNFYNNGATLGSLSGTPFVDTNVPMC